MLLNINQSIPLLLQIEINNQSQSERKKHTKIHTSNKEANG